MGLKQRPSWDRLPLPTSSGSQRKQEQILQHSLFLWASDRWSFPCSAGRCKIGSVKSSLASRWGRALHSVVTQQQGCSGSCRGLSWVCCVAVAANERRERDAGAGEVPVGAPGAHRGPGDADSEQPELSHQLGAQVNHHRGPLRLLEPAATSQQPKNSTQTKHLLLLFIDFALFFFFKGFV